jgi:hypothetical protein
MKSRRHAWYNQALTVPLLLCLCLSCPVLTAQAGRHAAESSGNRDPSEATILKRAIVSSLAVRSVGENSREAYDEWNDNILNLLAIFDPLNSPDDLKTFASLSAYYMGEAAGGIYRCLALRKGPALKPYLLASLKTGRAECENRFADAKVYDGLKNSVCLGFKPFVEDMLQAIQSGQQCSSRDLADTMGY